MEMGPTRSMDASTEKRCVCVRGGGGGGCQKKTQKAGKNAAWNPKTRGTTQVGGKNTRGALDGEKLMVTGHHLHT
jgi:hypothetical protein